MMDAQLKAKWVDALRSGKYSQCEGFLESRGGHCCLGVLVAMQGENVAAWGRKNLSMLPDEFSAGLPKGEMLELASLNDGTNGKPKHTFSEIADYIEANL